MTQIMIASGMSDGQIETAVEQLRAAMRKHRDEIHKEAAQQALGVENLGMRMFTFFRELAEAVSNLIVRHVRVDRNRSPKQVLDATGRRQYTDSNAVETMPRGEGKESDLYFFKLARCVNDSDLEKEYDLRGLKPADPYSLAAVNETDSSFSDERPNGTHWQDANGSWCYAAFDRWRDARYVHVYRNDYFWHDYWWFAGLRK